MTNPYFNYVSVCLSVSHQCMYLQRRKEGVRSPVASIIGRQAVPGTELQPSEKTASAFNHFAISPALWSHFLNRTINSENLIFKKICKLMSKGMLVFTPDTNFSFLYTIGRSKWSEVSSNILPRTPECLMHAVTRTHSRDSKMKKIPHTLCFKQHMLPSSKFLIIFLETCIHLSPNLSYHLYTRSSWWDHIELFVAAHVFEKVACENRIFVPGGDFHQ